MLKDLKITSGKVIFFLSLYLGFVLNLAFFKTLFLKFPITQTSQFLCVAFLVLISPLPVFAFLNLVLTKHTLKPLSCVILFISSATNYMMLTMGIYINYSMIRNVFETNTREALDLVSLPVVLYTAVFGVIPAILICKLKIEFAPFKAEWKRRARYIGLSVVAIAIYMLIFGKFIVPFGRNNSEIKAQYNTLNYITNTIKYVKKSLKTPKKFTIIDDAPTSTIENKNVHVFVLMIGETARAKNFSLYGYERETNPLLKKENNLIAIPDTASCGTATALSVPCMFSAKNRSKFDLDYAGFEENVLDVIKKTGWNIIWFENDDGCKQVCTRVETRNIVKIGNNEHCFGDFCHDEALLDHLKNTLEKVEKNTLIVLHTMGSHGPSYYKRYPKEFEKFKPSCDTIDIQNCGKEELTNVYDNTIVYTDYIIAKTIDLLKAHTNFETSLIYVSDHGESLGEGGLYLHGMPYKIAPKEQKTVPFLLWFSDKAITDSHIDADCLKNKAWENNSHDDLFHTMLGITGTGSKLYNKDLDVISACRK